MNGSPLAWYNQNRQYAFLKNAHHDVVGSLGDNGLGDVASYEPFGELNQKSEIRNPKSPLGYQGQFSDPDSGLSHMNNRVYSAETGQFLSPDSFPSVISEPGSLNRYAYTQNDPVNTWDVTGAYGMPVHYTDTFAWAKDAAFKVNYKGVIGFSEEMANRIADNIASFDQYHDKEWSLAPNNYSAGDSQGNPLHFPNPLNDQQNTKTIGTTRVAVYAMKSLADLNTKAGADKLVEDPNFLHVSYKPITTLFLKSMNAKGELISKGTVTDRLRYAVSVNDPRLFGIAMHEYQDTFAHAGFSKWHGMSSDNDIYCEGSDKSPECTGIKTVKSGNTFFFNYDGVPLANQLLNRDKLMKEGTKYWMEKFMLSQATYYDKAIQGMTKAQALSKKEENTLNEWQLDSLNVDQDWSQFDNLKMKITEDGEILQLGVYARQAVGVGNAPCLDLFKNFANPEYLKKKNPECGDFINDSTKQIIR